MPSSLPVRNVSRRMTCITQWTSSLLAGSSAASRPIVRLRGMLSALLADCEQANASLLWREVSQYADPLLLAMLLSASNSHQIESEPTSQACLGCSYHSSPVLPASSTLKRTGCPSSGSIRIHLANTSPLSGSGCFIFSPTCTFSKHLQHLDAERQARPEAKLADQVCAPCTLSPAG